MGAYTLPCVKQITNGNLLYDSELQSRLCNNVEWWEGVGGGSKVQEGRDTFIPTADSCQYMVEANKIP